MSQTPLFPLPEPRPVAEAAPLTAEEVRVLRPDRQQLRWVAKDLDAELREDHPARAIWAFLERMDLSGFYVDIKARLDGPGRPASDPQVLLALWLLGTVEGIGSARQLARLCEQHDAYRWLCGGVPVNYHLLSDFRVTRQAALDDLMSQIVAALMAAGAVKLERVAQDGMRVRASAGAASFRRKEGLKHCLKEAQAQVQYLAEMREHPDPGLNKRQQAARERAARECLERVERALAYLPQAEATKEVQKQHYRLSERARVTEARNSTTDPEAHVMKMPDGGFRPAYNVQFATDSERGVIVAVAVTGAGTDAGLATPAVDQIERRTGRRPMAYLIDGGYAVREDITSLEQRGVEVYAPVRLPRNRPEWERYAPRYGDTPEVAAWRLRMATANAKAVYRQRGSLAEWVNAQTRQHGISQFNVRGIPKLTSVLLIVAIAHNITRWLSLMT